MAKHLLEIFKNTNGSNTAVLYPLNNDGSTQCGYRIAGPVAYGSRLIADMELDIASLVEYVNEYAPDEVKSINGSENGLSDNVNKLLEDLEGLILAVKAV